MICDKFEAKIEQCEVTLHVKKLHKIAFCDKYLSHRFKNVTAKNPYFAGVLGVFVTKTKILYIQ